MAYVGAADVVVSPWVVVVVIVVVVVEPVVGSGAMPAAEGAAGNHILKFVNWYVTSPAEYSGSRNAGPIANRNA